MLRHHEKSRWLAGGCRLFSPAKNSSQQERASAFCTGAGHTPAARPSRAAGTGLERETVLWPGCLVGQLALARCLSQLPPRISRTG